jgi:protoheme IX farnesyltransferase
VTGFARLALISALGVYLLIVMGAVVRVTGSGLGCPDWPLCHGQIVPPADFHAIVEYVHRTIAALVGVPLALLFLAAWRSQRGDRLVFRSVNLMMLLLVPQVLLGREVVLRELPPMLVAVHLAIALTIMALAVVAAATTIVRRRAVAGSAAGPADRASASIAPPARFPTSLALTTVGVFFLLLTGAYTRASGASWVCPGFPLCDGGLPLGNRLVDVHMLHRLTATVVGASLVYHGLALARRWAHERGIVFWGRTAALAAVLQFGVGVAQVSIAPLPLFQILHVAGGTATWASTVALATLLYHATRRAAAPAARAGGEGARPRAGTGAEPDAARPRPPRWAAYLSLTKPRIIILLLVTALGGMLLAADGLPPPTVVLFTLLGGALSAGGANAINCYIDRDIDGLMGRTTLRPIPAGLVPPARALLFGIGLTVASLLVFGLLVNPLAGALAFGAMLYYVFVYTRWLKRSTPSNIVIGGAAGALPPVIGWAAVSGELAVLPLWLFAIVFYWTPPHFWALSLLIKREYERARVPMLPIVRGDAETRRQILWYSLLLVAVTAVLVPFGLMGPIYLASALLLGGIFVYYALRLRREATPTAARRLFHFSLYYLTLLFAAMVVDRRIPL